MELLLDRGAVLSYNDPHVPKLPRMRHHRKLELTSHPLEPDFLGSQDCVLVATDHSAYDYDMIVRHSRLVIDTRNATKNVRAGREKIRKA
jgi:UDP-N-acetyl-D-glucosamine dehydrogenase